MFVNWFCIKVHGLYTSSAVCLCRACADSKQWQWIYGEMEVPVQLGLHTPSLAKTLAGPPLGLGQEPGVGKQQNSSDTATYFVCVRAPGSKANPNGFGHSPYGLCCGANHYHWEGAEHHQWMPPSIFQFPYRQSSFPWVSASLSALLLSGESPCLNLPCAYTVEKMWACSVQLAVLIHWKLCLSLQSSLHKCITRVC